MSTTGLVEDFYRHEYGRLVSILSCRVGFEHLEAVEDAVQTALMTALEVWPRAGKPDNPSGWIYTVARNALLQSLRRTSRDIRLVEALAGPAAQDADVVLVHEMRDGLLRMLFACCDASIPASLSWPLRSKHCAGSMCARLRTGSTPARPMSTSALSARACGCANQSGQSGR